MDKSLKDMIKNATPETREVLVKQALSDMWDRADKSHALGSFYLVPVDKFSREELMMIVHLMGNKGVLQVQPKQPPKNELH